MSPHTPDARLERALVYLVGALVWLYLARDLAQVSMGLDGVVYASIANMAADGQGAFWAMPYFEAGLESFVDHPPLGVWLQSLWFGLLGDAFWVEKLYCVVLTAAVSGLMILLWRDVCHRQGAWLPLLIFFLMPVATYSVKNNTLDTLIAMTSLFGVWLAWRGQQVRVLNLGVGLAAVAGFLVKGPVGLIPLAAPGCLALIQGAGLKQAFFNSALAGGALLGAGSLLLLQENALTMLNTYFSVQLMSSLSGERLILNDRGYLVVQLAYNLLVPVFFVVMAWRLQRFRQPDRAFYSFLVMGLLASLPLLLSPRQFRHYLLPSLPFYALAAGCLINPVVQRWRPRFVQYAVATAIVLGCLRAAWHFGDPGRHAAELADAGVLASLNPPGETLVFCDEAIKLRAYLGRHYGVMSMVVSDWSQASVLVCPSEPAGYMLAQQLSSGVLLWRSSTVD